MNVIIALVSFGQLVSRSLLLPTTLHLDHDIQRSLRRPELNGVGKSSVHTCIVGHLCSISDSVDKGLSKLRIRRSMLIGINHRMNRDFRVLGHLVKHSIHSIVLKKWNLVSVTEDPEFDQKVPSKVDLSWHSLVLRECLSVKPDLESLEDINLNLRQLDSALGCFFE